MGDLQGDFQGRKQRRGKPAWEGREKQDTKRGSSHSPVSLMKEFEFCPVEGGAIRGSLLADKFYAQIDFVKCDAYGAGRTGGGTERRLETQEA